MHTVYNTVLNTTTLLHVECIATTSGMVTTILEPIATGEWYCFLYRCIVCCTAHSHTKRPYNYFCVISNKENWITVFW